MPELAPPQQTDEFLYLPKELLRLATMWSKSNVIRHVIGGHHFGNTDVRDQLATGSYDPLGDDIKSAIEVGFQLEDQSRPTINPGNSRALFVETRFKDYMDLKKDPDLRPRKYKLSAMQRRRLTPVDSSVVDWDLIDMMELEGGTTQWAAAAILLQDRDVDEIDSLMRSVKPEQRLMLRKSKAVRARLLGARALGNSVSLDERDYDMTILRQIQGAFTNVVNGPTPIKARHSEDVYAAIFSGALTPKQALWLYPQIVNHEVNRYEESIRLLHGDRKKPLNTEDHRAAQMALLLLGYNSWTKTTEKAINKTYPQYFEAREKIFELAA